MTSCSTQPTTRFIWSFARWGLVVDAGGAYLLPRLVGLPRAKAMVLLGEEVVGAEAVTARPGLPLHRLGRRPGRRGAEALAVRLADGPTRSLGLSKQLLNTDLRDRPAASLDREGHAQALATCSPEMAEGMAAFKEKRKPRFADPD